MHHIRLGFDAICPIVKFLFLIMIINKWCKKVRDIPSIPSIAVFGETIGVVNEGTHVTLNYFV